MTANQNQKMGLTRLRTRYVVLIGVGILISVLFVVGIFYFWEEIEHRMGYGYLTNFLVSIIGGSLFIPISNMPVVFVLGNRLNPVYVGLIAGFGEAIGGIDAYLAGAGGKILWYKFMAERMVLQPTDSSLDKPVPTQVKPRSRWRILFKRLAAQFHKRSGSWAIFITSSVLWWLSYPVAIAAGTSGIGLKRFFLISWAGKTVRGLIIAFAGYWAFEFFLKIPLIAHWLGG
jgi:membrane protein YqaA with SNARE-associated domain